MWRWGAITVGFGGIVMILKPFGGSFSPYMLLPILAALGYAVSSVLIRRYPDDASSSGIQVTQQLYTMLITVILLFLVAEPVPIASATDAGILLLMGIFGGTGVLCLIISYRLAPPSVIAPFEYFGAIQKELEQREIPILCSGFERIPTTTKSLPPEQIEEVEKLLEKIEEDDDVQNVYHTMV